MIAIKVLDNQTGEPLPNAHVFPVVNGVPKHFLGTSTNIDGVAEIAANTGEEIQVTFIGYKDFIFEVTDDMQWSGENEYYIMEVGMDEDANLLDAAIIVGKKADKSIVAIVAVLLLVAIGGLIIYRS